MIYPVGSLAAFASSPSERMSPPAVWRRHQTPEGTNNGRDQIIPVLALTTLGIFLVFGIAQFMWTQQEKRQRQDIPLVR